MAPDSILKGALLEGDALETEYRLRKRDYIECSLDKAKPIPEGWALERELKTRNRIRREKSVREKLEDRVWRLFYEIGAQALSDRDFTLALKRRGGVTEDSKIDVAAVVDDVVFIVRCASDEGRSNRRLDGDVADLASSKKAICSATRSCLDEDDLRFVFVLATEDIDCDVDDIGMAEERGVLLWDEVDQIALLDLAKVAGKGAKYQLLNLVFYGKKVKGFDVRVPALKAKMGGHTYYTLVMNPEHLLRIAYVHQRPSSRSWLDMSASYQRAIDSRRVRKVESFIRGGGFFPGSIILNFTRDIGTPDKLGSKKELANLQAAAKPVIVTLPPYYGSAWIVDGQHRLYGYANTEHRTSETMPVVAFVNESPATQAKMFVDVNKNQKAVGPELLWDLYEDLYSESTEEKEQELRAISRIAKELARSPMSPFEGHIKIPSNHDSTGNITLNAVCLSISRERLVAKPKEKGKDKGKVLLFHKDCEQTVDYASERIAAFFDVFRILLPGPWDKGEDHYIRTSAAFVVLSGVLRDFLSNLEPAEKHDIATFREQAERYMFPLAEHLHEADASVLKDYRGAGGAGQASRRLRAEFTRIIQADPELQFRSKWLEDYDEKEAGARVEEARRLGLIPYLEAGESERLEFKGSLARNLDRLLKGDGKLEDDDDVVEAVLKTIVAFLNTGGGSLLIGVVELKDYGEVLQSRPGGCPVCGEYAVLGLENDYRGDGWDGFQRRLVDLVSTRIGSHVLDSRKVMMERQTHQGKDVCRVTVEAARTRQYLDGGRFYVRRGPSSVVLTGPEIDRYWDEHP